MNDHLHLSTRHHQILEALIRQHLPGIEVWAYGSRVNGRSHDGSDLDLVLRAPGLERVPTDQLSDFEDALRESSIPFLVEARDWARLPERFHREIERDHVVITYSTTQETTFGSLLAQPVRNGIYKTKEFHGRGVKMVNMGELFAHPRLRNVSMKRVELNASEIDRFSVKKGDLLFARRSLVAEGAGKCCVVLEVSQPTAFESSIIRARPDPEKADSLYIFYYFSSPLGLHRLDTIRRQVAVAGITGGDLASLGVRLPPVHHQRAVAHVLATLDDKIELNRRMNETLEAMAQAIFKDWFVDFGPTRAKAEGRAPYLAPELWDLFPDALDDEGKPVGWQVRELRELVSVTRGRSYRSIDLRDSNVALVTLKSFKRGGGYRGDGLKPYTGRYKAEQVVEEGELVVALTDVTQAADVIGKPAIVLADERFDTLVASLDVGIVRIQDGRVGQTFVSQLLRTEQFQSHAYSHSTGTTVLHLSKDALPIFRVCIPPSQLAARFEEVVGPISSRDAFNAYESRSLAQTRDLLLPKLMSGQVRLRDAEKVIEAVA